MTSTGGGIADLRPLERAREQKAWYWYDWANSAYTTTIGTVFFGPYFISLAENAVGGEDGRFEVAGLSLPPDSLFFWLITVSTILSAIVLPPLGAYADRVANKKRLEEREPAQREKRFAELRAMADDPKRHKAFLMRASLLERS